MVHFPPELGRLLNPPREFGSASRTDDWPLSAWQVIKVGLPDIPIIFMTVRRRPIAGQITAAGVRQLDGLVLFVGTKRTGRNL